MRDVGCIADVGTRDDSCPYCAAALGRSPKRAAICKVCSRRYRVRDRKREDGCRLLTEAEALFMEALRGGSLVPELFRYDLGAGLAWEDLPHHNPETVAQGDAEVNRRWGALRASQPRAGPSEYLWKHYSDQIQATEALSFRHGYLLFRQAELAAADRQYEASARIIMDAAYVAACADAVTMDWLADPPVEINRDFEAHGVPMTPPAWLRLVCELRDLLRWSSADWGRVTEEMAARWRASPRAQRPDLVWREVDKHTNDRKAVDG